MYGREIPLWRRWVGLSTAALMLTLSLGSPVAMAASTLAGGTATQPSDQEQETLVIGIIDLEANGVDATEAKAITDRLRIWLGRTGTFEVIERNQMETIMEEMGFQASGACNTNECVVQVGQVLGASKMVAGSVSRVGTLYSLQIRMIDIATSRIENPLFKDVNGIEQVFQQATQEIADELAGLVRQQLGQPFQPVDPEEQARQQAAARQTDPQTDPARQQEDPQTPPVTEEQPGEDPGEQATPQRRGRFPWWLLLLGAVGGGTAYLLGGEDPGTEGPEGTETIGTPPDRPTIPPR